MNLIYYIIKQLISALRYRIPLKKTDIIRSYKLYKQTPSEIRKGIKDILFELNKLCKEYHCFDDAYFRHLLFLKEAGNNFAVLKSFVPQHFYAKWCIDDKDPRYRILIDDKILFHRIMTQWGFPIPRIYFIFKNDTFCDLNNIPIDKDQVDLILSKVNNPKIFMKRPSGGAGSGVSCFFKEKGKYIDNSGLILSAANILNHFHGQTLFFEEQLIQAHELSQFNEDTINTIRVLTYNIDCNNYGILSAAVRFGRKGSFMDNTAQGGVAVNLNIETAKLGCFGLREYELLKFSEHPDSHRIFKDTHIPQWEAVRNLVNEVTLAFPYFKSVGFDIAITTKGPVIIEINTGAGIYLSQMGMTSGLFNKLDKLSNLRKKYID